MNSTRRPITTSAAVAVALLLVSVLACTSSKTDAGQASLVVTFDGAAVQLDVVPTLGRLEEALFIKATDGNVTVFANIPRESARPGTLSVGTTVNEDAIVWAQDGPTTQPLTASSGALIIDTIDVAQGGLFAARLVDVQKPVDATGPSITIDGTVRGSFD